MWISYISHIKIKIYWKKKIYEKKLKNICYNFSDMKDKFLFIMLSIYKLFVWIDFFQGMVIELVFNNEIQIFFFSNQFIFWKKKL